MPAIKRCIQTPLGWFTLVENDEAITNLLFGRAADDPSVGSSLLAEAEKQVRAYLEGKLQRFTLPLNPQGTAFQLLCWNALAQIPYGQTQTYGQLAKQIGRPGAARAVGMAAHRNPLPILIPCHRLIGAGERLTGYAGGIALKESLLHLEENSNFDQRHNLRNA